MSEKKAKLAPRSKMEPRSEYKVGDRIDLRDLFIPGQTGLSIPDEILERRDLTPEQKLRMRRPYVIDENRRMIFTDEKKSSTIQ